MYPEQKDDFEIMVADVMGASVNGRRVSDMWWNILSPFEFNAIRAALKKHAMKNKFAPAPAEIIRIIYNFMSAEEAWNHFPKYEHQGALVTQEMQRAFGACIDSIERKDLISARMAFLEAYETAISDSIAESKPPKYSYSAPSEGDPDQKRLEKQRAYKIAEGKGLISPERARKSLLENFAEPTYGVIENQMKRLEGAVNPNLVTEEGQKSGREEFQKLKAQLKKKSKKMTEEEDEDCE